MNAYDIEAESLAKLFVNFPQHLIRFRHFDAPALVAQHGLPQPMDGTDPHPCLSAGAEINAEFINDFVFQCRLKSLSRSHILSFPYAGYIS
jgi:hypothetical protein